MVGVIPDLIRNLFGEILNHVQDDGWVILDDNGWCHSGHQVCQSGPDPESLWRDPESRSG